MKILTSSALVQKQTECQSLQNPIRLLMLAFSDSSDYLHILARVQLSFTSGNTHLYTQTYWILLSCNSGEEKLYFFPDFIMKLLFILYGTEAWMSILNNLKEIHCEAVFISVLPVHTKSQDISIEKEQGCWHFQRKKVIYFLFYIFKDLTLNLICKGNDIKISWHLYNDVKYRSTITQIQFYTWLAI